MIVVDTNVIAALILQHDGRQWAERLWERDSSWQVPFLWASEFRNVVLAYYRKGLATLEDCREAMSAARLALPPANEHEPDDRLVLQLAAGSGCSAYDCEFIAVAQTLTVPLITWDKQILRSFHGAALTPEEYLP